MSWASDTKQRLQVFAIGLLFLCPGFLIWNAAQTWRQIASSGWPSVSGEVIDTEAKAWASNKKELMYYGRVRYRYTVDGKEYTTDLTDLGAGRKRHDSWEALADVNEFQPRQKVTVYYDPADPSVGILRKGIPDNNLILLVGLGIGTVFGVVGTVLTVRDWSRGWRQSRAEASRQERVADAPRR